MNLSTFALLTHALIFGHAVSLFSFASTVTATEQLPNIVVIVADDMGYADVISDSPDRPSTPHLDRLASRGTTLTSFYCASPICTPSRAAFYTGRHPQRYGFTDDTLTEVTRMGVGIPQDEFYISKALQNTGYATGAFGKWNQGFAEGSRPTERGFDEFLGNPSGGIYYFEGSYSATYSFYDDITPVELEGYSATLYTDALLDFLESKKAAPFFAHIAFTNPHSPVDPKNHPNWAPDEFLQMYEGVTPENRRQYLAAITAMDHEIGRILDKLDAEDLTQNTLIIFYSDNGSDFTSSNAPFSGTKKEVEEGGIRVPSIVAWPGTIPGGASVDEPVTAMDFFPLILNAAGAVVEPGSHPIDGRDPIPALQGAAEEPLHEHLRWRFRDGWAIRKGNYKLSDDGLFDLASDPGETTDLSTALPGIKQDLQDLYDQWEDEVYNNGPLPQTYPEWLSEHGLPTDGSGLGATTASPTEDNVENLIKYQFGLDPWVSGLQGAMNLIPNPGPDAEKLALQLIMPKPLPNDANFIPQFSTDLEDWSREMEEIMTVVNHDGTQTVYLREPLVDGEPSSRFARVMVLDPGGDPTPDIPGLNLNAQASGLVPYSDQDDRGTGPTIGDISADGSSVTFSGNDWERIELANPVTITATTTLQITFSSSQKGEFHGIALDDDTDWQTPRRVISFYGTQHDTRAVNDFHYVNSYYGGERVLLFLLTDFVGYTVGDTLTHLCFINDGDNGNTGVGTYSNIKIYD